MLPVGIAPEEVPIVGQPQRRRRQTKPKFITVNKRSRKPVQGPMTVEDWMRDGTRRRIHKTPKQPVRRKHATPAQLAALAKARAKRSALAAAKKGVVHHRKQMGMGVEYGGPLPPSVPRRGRKPKAPKPKAPAKRGRGRPKGSSYPLEGPMTLENWMKGGKRRIKKVPRQKVPKRKATPAQLAALARAREVRRANLMMRNQPSRQELEAMASILG